MECQHQSNDQSVRVYGFEGQQAGQQAGVGICGHGKGERGARVNHTGHWNEQENARYYAFLSRFKPELSERESRRQCKVFKAMSEFLKSRTPKQCRSHHHKMKLQSRQIDDILEFLANKNQRIVIEAQKHRQELLNKTVEDFTAPGDQLNSQQLLHCDLKQASHCFIKKSIGSFGSPANCNLSAQQLFSIYKTNLENMGKTPVTNCNETPICSPQKTEYPSVLPPFQPPELHSPIYKNIGPYTYIYIPTVPNSATMNKAIQLKKCQYFLQRWSKLAHELFEQEQA